MASIFEDFINKLRNAQMNAQARTTYSTDRAFDHVLRSPNNGVVQKLSSFLSDEQKAAAEAAQKERRIREGIPYSGDYEPVWGFEKDMSRYSDIKSSDPKETDKLTWRDYTVTPKGDERASKNFAVGYDDKGKIAGVRYKSEDGSIRGYYGKEKLKSFFSKFDRDATSYKVWQSEEYGDNSGQSAIIFDSDKGNEPFIPSRIFKNKGLRPLPVALPYLPTSLPEIDATFYDNYRSSK